jgi:hypothetical protein
MRQQRACSVDTNNSIHLVDEIVMKREKTSRDEISRDEIVLKRELRARSIRFIEYIWTLYCGQI